MTASASLSVCLLARKPAGRVRALVELFRPLADEIVLAVDIGGDPQTLEGCHELVDQLYRVQSAPFNRWSGWLHTRCRADWVLRVEDDEVPSRALLDALPELLSTRSQTHVALTRRWLHPDTGSYITTHPWQPDYQVRLVRNVPGLWRFPGILHAPIEVLGERRLEDLPIYHCDCLLSSLEERRHKRAAYEERRRHLTSDGFSVNFMYTPEDCPGVRTVAIPSPDGALIDAVSRGSVLDDAGSAAPDLPVLSLDAEDSYSETRSVGDGAYEARLSFVDPPRSITAGTVSQHELLVENLGSERWPSHWGGEPLIRLGYRWFPDSLGASGTEGPRTPFTETVPPGGSTRTMLAVHAPQSPGRLTLEADVVHEHVRWFGCPVRLELDVEEPA